MSELSIPLSPQVLFYLAVLLIAGATLVAQVSRQLRSGKRRRPRRASSDQPSMPSAPASQPSLQREAEQLQELVLKAERQIGRLEELIRTARSLVPPEAPRPFIYPRPAEAETTTDVPERQRQPQPETAWQRPSPDTVQPAKTAEKAPPPPPANPPEARPKRMLSLFVGEPSATNSNPRYRELHRLFEAGFDSREISNRLGVPIGEVELVLGLRQHAQNLRAASRPATLDDAG